MPNLTKVISGHNAKVVADTLPKQRPSNSNCNCRGGIDKCPVDGARCKDSNVIYQADDPGRGSQSVGTFITDLKMGDQVSS